MAIYMKFGHIDGQVTTEGFAKWIELNNVNMGIHRTTKTPTGGRFREASNPQISEIHISKSFDKATPQILQQSVAGAFANRVDIRWTTTTKSKVDTFFEVQLEDCGITGYEQSSGRDGAPPQENITLNFSKTTFRASPLDNKGQPETAPIVGYDLLMMKTL